MPITKFDHTVTSQSACDNTADCVIAPVTSDGDLSGSIAQLNDALGGQIDALRNDGLITGSASSSLLLSTDDRLPCKALLLVGVGPTATISLDAFVEVLKQLYCDLSEMAVNSAALYLDSIEVEDVALARKLRTQVQHLQMLEYRYRRPATEHNCTIEHAFDSAWSSNEEAQIVAKEGAAIARAINRTRQLADTPPNVCTPSYIARQAQETAANLSDVSTDVLDESAMADLGMNVLLSVGQGSDEPSRLVVLKYAPKGIDLDPIVLIGKGITFDTGGTALKTRDGMRLMKYDMCGAATVLSVLEEVARLQLPINLVAICACAENMPGSKATRPSDTVTSLSGKTVEILNPDAEGRLVLCDALTFSERFRPRAVIDVATLTGASVVALGHHYSALFANDDQLADALEQAGLQAGDSAWRLPLSSADDAQLQSKFADVANMGNGSAACVVAALFLARFTTKLRWAHLDISGSSKLAGSEAVSTGRPAALLMQYILDQSNAPTN